MIFRNTVMLLSISLLTGACNLNATNGDGGDPEPDEDVNFEIIKSSGIPGNTAKAKAVDLDNNGAVDLVLAIEGQRNIIMINEGSDGFTEDSTRLPDQGYTFNTRDLTITDFNGDG